MDENFMVIRGILEDAERNFSEIESVFLLNKKPLETPREESKIMKNIGENLISKLAGKLKGPSFLPGQK